MWGHMSHGVVLCCPTNIQYDNMSGHEINLFMVASMIATLNFGVSIFWNHSAKSNHFFCAYAHSLYVSGICSVIGKLSKSIPAISLSLISAALDIEHLVKVDVYYL